MNSQLRDPSLQRLADANPAPPARLTPEENARAEALLYRITSAPPASAVPQRSSANLRARLAAVVVAVLAVVVGSTLATAPASAEGVLLKAASAAANQPVEDGRYWYVHTTVIDPATVPFHREIWKSRDGVGDVLRDGFWAAERAKNNGSDTPDPSMITTQKLQTGDEPTPATFGDGVTVTWEELENLPTDAAELKSLLEEQMSRTGNENDDDALWSATTALLTESPASSELRRALWEVAATIPGVELLGQTTDSLEREGTAVKADFGDRYPVVVIILDPNDGTVLERRTLGPDGQVIAGSTLIEQGPRDNAPTE